MISLIIPLQDSKGMLAVRHASSEKAHNSNSSGLSHKMRLLNTFSGCFTWTNDPRKVRYAILSHTWSRDGEQSYQDILKLQESARWRRGAWFVYGLTSQLHERVKVKRFAQSANSRTSVRDRAGCVWHHSQPSGIQLTAVLCISGAAESELPLSPGRLLVRRVGSFFSAPTLSAKIKGACKIARERGYRFIWIDTCCIDKTSSAELSEAINSMYLWYTLADVCLVYLADVPRSPDVPQIGRDSKFWWSRWHERGWTLQELIAPRYMLFFDCDWSVLGSKTELASTLAERTGVDAVVLVHAMPLRRISVADRMRWAFKRKTTRIEDEAYCLMGLFGVHMPTIYGEGRKAFIRLQQEIVRTIPDQSLFVWGPAVRFVERTLKAGFRTLGEADMLLALSPSAFVGGLRGIEPIGLPEFQALVDSVIPERAPGSPSSVAARALSPADCSFTAYGALMRLPCIDLAEASHIRDDFFQSAPGDGEDRGCNCDVGAVRWLALLACETARGEICAVPLHRLSQAPETDDGRQAQASLGVGFHREDSIRCRGNFRIVCISRETVEGLRRHVSMQELCIRAHDADADDKEYERMKRSLMDSDTPKVMRELPASVAYAAGCVTALARQGFVLAPVTIVQDGRMPVIRRCTPTIADGVLLGMYGLGTRFTTTISSAEPASAPGRRQCVHVDIKVKRNTMDLYSLRLRHFFGDSVNEFVDDRDTGSGPRRSEEQLPDVPSPVRERLRNAAEVDVWYLPGPASPAEWAPLANLEGRDREHASIFYSTWGCLHAEVLLRASCPSTSDAAAVHGFKVRILRITSRPVDYTSLHAGRHPMWEPGEERCEGPLVLSLVVELSEPVDIYRVGSRVEGWEEDDDGHRGERMEFGDRRRRRQEQDHGRAQE
ncbi:hypothetical protein BV20DRAFT_982971 [Pilatotrama ljubarskyi]|nr:hypothetical protein BV20DRAFT_982971 [Pilatotrama ljubarskyi]